MPMAANPSLYLLFVFVCSIELGREFSELGFELSHLLLHQLQPGTRGTEKEQRGFTRRV